MSFESSPIDDRRSRAGSKSLTIICPTTNVINPSRAVSMVTGKGAAEGANTKSATVASKRTPRTAMNQKIQFFSVELTRCLIRGPTFVEDQYNFSISRSHVMPWHEKPAKTSLRSRQAGEYDDNRTGQKRNHTRHPVRLTRQRDAVHKSFLVRFSFSKDPQPPAAPRWKEDAPRQQLGRG